MGVCAFQILFLNSEMHKTHANVWHVLMCGDCDVRCVHWFVHLCTKLTGSIIMKYASLTVTEIGCFPNNCHCGKQDRQCTYNTTWRAFVQPLFLWKGNEYYTIHHINPIFWSCVCILSYPACIAHAPYIVIRGELSDPAISSPLSYKWNDFKKKYWM
jgi:hypothetical protein